MRSYDIIPLVAATVVVIASILYDRWRAGKNRRDDNSKS